SADVEGVVEIEIQRRSGSPGLEELSEPHVELVQPLPKHLTGRNEVHCDVRRAADQVAAERLPHFGIRNNTVRYEQWSGKTLKRSADQHVHFGHRVGAQELVLREEWRFDATVRVGETDSERGCQAQLG